MRAWKLDGAKHWFRKCVRQAAAHEPQIVTKHGREAVVLLSMEDYRGLVAPHNLADFLRDSPLADAVADCDLELGRAQHPEREIDL